MGGEITYIDAAGEAVSWNEVREAVAGARIIFAGESHDQAAHHRMQAQIVAAAAELGPVVVLLEMLPWDDNDALIALSDGHIGVEMFAERVAWNERWGYDIDLYAPLFALAAHPRVRFLGANAPAGFSRTLAREGWDALPAETRRRIPASLVEPAPDHRVWLEAAMQGHGHEMPPEVLARFVLAQSLWDTTMGGVAAAAHEALGPEARIVVVAGSGHVRHGWGVPAVVAQLSGGVPTLSVLCDIDDADAADLRCSTISPPPHPAP